MSGGAFRGITLLDTSMEVDNRAREMGRDFRLPTKPRSEMGRLAKMIDEPTPLDIALPWDDLRGWLAQWKENPSTRDA